MWPPIYLMPSSARSSKSVDVFRMELQIWLVYRGDQYDARAQKNDVAVNPKNHFTVVWLLTPGFNLGQARIWPPGGPIAS